MISLRNSRFSFLCRRPLFRAGVRHPDQTIEGDPQRVVIERGDGVGIKGQDGAHSPQLLGRQNVTQAVNEALYPLPFSLDALSVRLALEFDDLVGSEVGVGQQ